MLNATRCTAQGVIIEALGHPTVLRPYLLTSFGKSGASRRLLPRVRSHSRPGAGSGTPRGEVHYEADRVVVLLDEVGEKRLAVDFVVVHRLLETVGQSSEPVSPSDGTQ